MNCGGFVLESLAPPVPPQSLGGCGGVSSTASWPINSLSPLIPMRR
jgi:hypothetical protein